VIDPNRPILLIEDSNEDFEVTAFVGATNWARPDTW
jgi:hypothetical protein